MGQLRNMTHTNMYTHVYTETHTYKQILIYTCTYTQGHKHKPLWHQRERS